MLVADPEVRYYASPKYEQMDYLTPRHKQHRAHPTRGCAKSELLQNKIQELFAVDLKNAKQDQVQHISILSQELYVASWLI